MENQEEQVKQLRDLLGRSPVDWDAFLKIDGRLKVIESESYGCSFAWILSHYPPPRIVSAILSRYQNSILANDETIKTILDMALYTSSLDVIEFLATNYKQIRDAIDKSGDIPLHRARRTDIALILLQHYPEAVGRRNENLDLPLHTAIRTYQSPEHIRLLIEYGMNFHVGGKQGRGGVHVANRLGLTPFSILCHQISSGIDSASLTAPLYQPDLRLWEKLKTMICLLFNIDVRHEHNFKLLHAIITLECPPEALDMAIVMIPDQIQQPAVCGRFPLSLAASYPIYPRRSLEKLLHYFAEAINISDEGGRYPLHWAASGGRTFSQGTDLLYCANPAIASIQDHTGMFPYMLAASSSKPLTDTIYRLLRGNPHIL